jgi:two-component system NtrC family sensor kinase
MVETKSGWIHYPWKNVTDPMPRMKIVRYLHFEPWDWIVAVGSYENEFLHDAEAIKVSVAWTTIVLVCFVGFGAAFLVFVASRAFTDPILRMTEVIRRVRGGALDEKMVVDGEDELGELADAYNRMGEKIRDHRDLENTLAQQGKMASLGVLSSGIAHEINNPLGVILGYAAYLENKLPPDDPNLPYIQEIRRESKRSKKIVQDLLSYARAPRPDLKPIDLNGLIDQIVDFAVNHTELERVRVEKRFDAELPAVEGDGDQLRQVAMNLLLNAGAAMPEGGSLTVSTRRSGEAHVEMVFSDTGVGMPEEVVERMFEPFFTTKAQGIGLGLSITRQIVERHQGTIHVESTPGRGTSITVRLPMRREEF